MGDPGLDAFGAQRVQQPFVTELALAPGDPLVVREVLQVDLVPVGERVPLGHGDLHGIVEDRRLGEPLRHGQRLVAVAGRPPGRRRPGARRSPRSPVPAFRDRTRSAGWSVRSAASAWGTAPHRGGERQATSSSPTTCPRWASRSDWASSTCDRMRAACSASSRPASVSRTPRPFLASSCWPISRSSLDICCETGRGRDVQPLGRAADRAVPGEGVEGAQAVQVQHVSNATRYCVKSLACATKSCPPSLQP
ncbi:hypothetical protein SGLAM104S_09177 [Streptomyces glaucescens]